MDCRYQEKVFNAIEKLPKGDVVKLNGFIDKYRLRVGFLRILFVMENGNIEIYKIEKRGDIYK
nr:type II toxin-antitoxin system RelE/ParE family toxin [Bathymodiolus heckerae thiotrophic gill symbiont]